MARSKADKAAIAALETLQVCGGLKVAGESLLVPPLADLVTAGWLTVTKTGTLGYFVRPSGAGEEVLEIHRAADPASTPGAVEVPA